MARPLAAAPSSSAKRPRTLSEHVTIVVVLVAVMFGAQWLVHPLGASHVRQARDVDPLRASDVMHYADGSTVTLVELIQRSGTDSGDEEEGPVDISLVVPAYNEEVRLPVMLRKTLPFLEQWSAEDKLRYEVIVVDDGSRDATVRVALAHAAQLSSPWALAVLKLAGNRGKGGAVKQGVKAARGKYVLMVDADGATDITALPRLYREVRRIEQVKSEVTGSTEPVGITIGSRAHLVEKSVATRAFYRTVLMKGFHLLVTVLCTKNIRDTQCGFKLFTRGAAKLLFNALHLESWAFDIELIYLAERLGIPMSEVAVKWEEVDGSKLIQSKLDVVFTSLNMARDMLAVRVAYIVVLWKV